MKAAVNEKRKTRVSEKYRDLMLRWNVTGLRNGFDVVSWKDEFVFLGGRVDDSDTLRHPHFSDELLAQEVTDLDDRVVLRGDAIDGEMGVDGAHFVFESLHKSNVSQRTFFIVLTSLDLLWWHHGSCSRRGSTQFGQRQSPSSCRTICWRWVRLWWTSDQ